MNNRHKHTPFHFHEKLLQQQFNWIIYHPPSEQVLKLVGPVLISQALDDAKQNVQKRIDYINAEVKRQEARFKELERKQDAQRETIQKLQQTLQQKMQALQKPK